MNSALTDQSEFNIIFAGFGASACLTLLELDRTGWLKGKRLAIIEPDRKEHNDRTFCFWAPSDSEIVQRFSKIISKDWKKVDFNGNVQDISPGQYGHIRGIDLYQHTRQMLANHDVTWLSDSVTEILPAEVGVVCRGHKVDTAGQWCFDSRPLPPWTPEFPDVAILQSFYGWRVRLTGTTVNPEAATMMDFDIDQHHFTQFMYRLPFHKDELLVELTRFGAEVIEPAYGGRILTEYLSERYGEYEILETETGVIPMEHGRAYPEPVNHRHIPLGTRAGLVKASTGYAFKRMFAGAQACAARLSNSETKKPTAKANWRFGFYDHLLLLILKLWPSRGREVFNRLITAVPAQDIMRFLDEQSGLRQEIRIFSKLPISLFIRAVLVREWMIWRKQPSELVLFASVAVASVLYFSFPTAAVWIIYPVLIAGLVVIGLPHGALDDMLEYRGGIRRIRPGFVFKYLAQGSVMLAFWWLWSPAALWIFLIYSAWHFGQADQEETETGNYQHRQTHIAAALLRGTIVLSVILLSHIPELNGILKELHVPEISGYWSGLVWPMLGAGVLASVIIRERKTLIGLLSLALTIPLPLLAAFGFYFIFQHSWRGWRHIRAKLGKTDMELFQIALPFHLAAWLLLGLLYFFNPTTYGETFGFGRIGLFFVFLSSLSFPHVLAMHRFYRASAQP